MIFKIIDVSFSSAFVCHRTNWSPITAEIALEINGDVSELSSRLTNLTPTEKNHCCYFLAAFFSRYFCLLLENHKSLFSEDIEFRISVNDVDEYNKYDTRTAYKGTVEGK